MFEPTKLKLLDGTTIHLMYSVGAGMRIKEHLGVSIFRNFAELLDEKNLPSLVRDMAVRWDDAEQWWMHDTDAPPEKKIQERGLVSDVVRALTDAWQASQQNPSTPAIKQDPPAVVQ